MVRSVQAQTERYIKRSEERNERDEALKRLISIEARSHLPCYGLAILQFCTSVLGDYLAELTFSVQILLLLHRSVYMHVEVSSRIVYEA